MDEHIRKGYALTSILNELFEEKVGFQRNKMAWILFFFLILSDQFLNLFLQISTQKKNHWILGPEDLNDTLVHDFEVEEAA